MPSNTHMNCNRVLHVLALLVIFNFPGSSHGIDSINRTHFIHDRKGESIVSGDGNFKLGFFSPGKSQFRYVGIWFNKISIQTVVWVANREIPIKNSAGIFKIGEDWNLAVFDDNENVPLWSTNASTPTKNCRAKLLDSGNLVLAIENDHSETETIIWQSFDHPTDTILPGMKFGFNRNTGVNHVLTSWKSSDDPAPGEFSGSFDNRGSPQYFLYKNSDPYWRCGPWDGRKMNGLPDVAAKLRNENVEYSNQIDIQNYAFVDNNNEVYSGYSSTNGTISRIILEPMGTEQRLIWHENKTWMKFWMAPQDLCDEYARCGVNAICNEDTIVQCACLPGFEPLYPQDWNLHCVEKRKVGSCGKGDREGFVRLETVKLPDSRNSAVYGNMSLKECERECLKSCNCTGYASISGNESEQACMAWYGELNDTRQYKDGHDFYLRVDAVELAASARKDSKHSQAENSMLAFIALPVVMQVLLIAACVYYFWRKHATRKGKKKKKQQHHRLSVFDSATSLSNHEEFPNPNSSVEGGNIELTMFKLCTVIAATDNFLSANKLGVGGFGPVYKGLLPNGQEIAVKRLSKNSGQGIQEFKNEVLLIAKLQHRNLVRLLGCCIEEDEKMLIYEFMPNRSLDYFIFDESRKQLLDWRKRFDIILGIARGILYLHQDSRLRIVHRDLKASNILLDGEMEPRISDFGTARLFGGDQTQENTNKVVGTFGYMSPEYVLHGIFSMKSDVFSFGVLILEIISGKKNRSFFPLDPFSNLIKYTWELWRDGKALEIVDPFIADSCPAPKVLRCIQVGLLCVQDDANDRPTMSSAIFMLSNETSLPSPKQSTFVIRRSRDKPDSFIKGTRSSINEVTITTFTAR